MSKADEFGLGVRLRDVRGLVEKRTPFHARCRYVYGQSWHAERLYVVFGIGMHRPMFIHLQDKWYAIDLDRELGALLLSSFGRILSWMYRAARPQVTFEKVLSCEDMRYLLHHCDVPPPPEIKRLLAVSPES